LLKKKQKKKRRRGGGRIKELEKKEIYKNILIRREAERDIENSINKEQ